MVIVFVISEHSADFLRIESHIKVIFGSYVPRRIVVVVFLGADFNLHALDVVNARKNHRPKCGVIFFCSFALQIEVAEH